MTKKDKILYRYISNIVNDEKPDCIQILTSRDISKLIARIEKTNTKNLSVSPKLITIIIKTLIYLLCLMILKPLKQI